MAIILTEERKQSICMFCPKTIHLHEYPFKLPDNNQRTSTNHSIGSVLIQSYSIWPNVLQCIGKMQGVVARSGGNFVRKAYLSEEAANKLKWWIRNIFDAFAPI